MVTKYFKEIRDEFFHETDNKLSKNTHKWSQQVGVLMRF